jgi:hypothetical protein
VAITRLGGANAISGTIPAANVATLLSSNMPSGSILQVQYNDITTNYTGTSSTNVDFPAWSFSFTPTSSSSKVLLIAIAVCDGKVYVKRNGSIIKDEWFSSTRVDHVNDYPYSCGSYLDSPATTSAITYQVGGRSTGCTNIIRFGKTDGSASMTIMEVAG